MTEISPSSVDLQAAELEKKGQTEAAQLVRARARRKRKTAAETHEAGKHASLLMGDYMGQIDRRNGKSDKHYAPCCTHITGVGRVLAFM